METKPGIKTTEFWVSVLAGAGSVIAAFANAIPPRYAVFASAASAGLYAVGRGLAKQGVKPDAS